MTTLLSADAIKALQSQVADQELKLGDVSDANLKQYVSLSHSLCSKLSQGFDDATSQLQNVSQQKESLSQNVNELTSALAAEQQTTSNLAKQVKDLSFQSETSKQSASTAKSELEIHAQALATMQVMLEETSAQHAKHLDDLKLAHEAQLEAHRQEMSMLTKNSSSEIDSIKFSQASESRLHEQNKQIIDLVGNYEEQIKNRDNAISLLKKKYAVLQDDISTYRESLQGKDNEIAVHLAKHGEYEQKLAGLLLNHEGQNGQFENQIGKLMEDIAFHQDKLADNAANHTHLSNMYEDKLEALLSANAGLKGKIDLHKQTIDLQNSNLKGHQKTIADLNKEHKMKDLRLTGFQNQLHLANNTISNQKGSLVSLKDTIGDHKESIKEHKNKLREMQKNVLDHQREIDNKAKAVLEIEDQNSSLAKTLEEHKANHQAIQAEHEESIDAHMQALFGHEQNKKDMEKEIQTMITEYENKIAGLEEIVADNKDVIEEHQKAISEAENAVLAKQIALDMHVGKDDIIARHASDVLAHKKTLSEQADQLNTSTKRISDLKKQCATNLVALQSHQSRALDLEKLLKSTQGEHNSAKDEAEEHKNALDKLKAEHDTHIVATMAKIEAHKNNAEALAKDMKEIVNKYENEIETLKTKKLNQDSNITELQKLNDAYKQMIEGHSEAMDSLHVENRANASKADEVEDLLNQLAKQEDNINGHLDSIDAHKLSISELENLLGEHKETIKGHEDAQRAHQREMFSAENAKQLAANKLEHQAQLHAAILDEHKQAAARAIADLENSGLTAAEKDKKMKAMIQNYEDQITDLQTKLSDMEMDRDDFSKKAGELGLQFVDLQQKLADMEGFHADKLRTMGESHDEIVELHKHQIESQKDSINSHANASSDLKGQLEERFATIQGNEMKIRKSQKEVAMHESKNGALQSKLAEQDAQHTALLEEHQASIKSHMKEIMSHKENQAAQEVAMEKMIKDYESQIVDLQTIINDNSDVIKEHQVLIEKLNEGAESHSQAMADVEIIHSEKERLINAHHNTIEELRKQLHAHQKDGRSMNAHLEDLTATHGSLLKKHLSAISLTEQHKSDLKSMTGEFSKLSMNHQDVQDSYDSLKETYQSALTSHKSQILDNQRKIKEQFKNLKVMSESYESKIDDLHKEKDCLMDIINEHKELIGEYEEKHAQLKLQNTEHSNNLSEQGDALFEHKKQINEHGVKLRRHENTIASLGEKLDASKTLNEDLQSQLKQKLEVIYAHEKGIRDHKKNGAAYSSEISGLKKKLGKQSDRHAAVVAEHDTRLLSHLHDIEKHKGNAEALQNDLTTMMYDYEAKLAAQEEVISAQEQKMKANETILHKFHLDTKTLNDNVAELELMHNDKSGELELLRDSLANHEHLSATQFAELESHKLTINSHESSLASLQKKLSDVHGQMEMQRTSIYGQKKGRMRLEQSLEDHKNQVAHLEAHHEAIAEAHAQSVKEHLDQINKHKGSISELAMETTKMVEEYEHKLKQKDDSLEDIDIRLQESLDVIAAYEEKFTNLNQSLDAAEEELAEKSKIISHHKGASQELKLVLAKHTSSTMSALSEAQIHKNEVARLQGLLTGRNGVIREHERTNRNFKRENNRHADRHGKLQSEFAKFKGIHDELVKEKKASMQKHLNEINKAGDSIEGMRTEMVKNINDYEAQILGLKETVVNQATQIQNSDAIIDELENVSGMTGEKLKEFETMAVEHSDALEAHNAQLSGHGAQKAALENLINGHKKEGEEYQNQIAILTAQCSEHQNLASGHAQSLSIAESDIAANQDKIAELKKQYEEHQQIHNQLQAKHATSLAAHMKEIENMKGTDAQKQAKLKDMCKQYEQRISDLEETILENKEAISNYELGVDDHKEQCSDYDRVLAEHLESIHGQNSLIAEHKGLIQSGVNEIQLHKGRISELNALLQTSLKNGAALKNQISDHMDTISGHEGKIRNHGRVLNKLQAKHDGLSSKYDELQATHDAIKQKHAATLAGKLGEITDSKCNIAQLKAGATRMVTEYEHKVEKLEIEISNMKEAITDLEAKCDEQGIKHQHYKSALEGHDDEHDRKDNLIKGHTDTIDELQNNLSSTMSDLAFHKEKHGIHKQNNIDLQSQLDDARDKISGYEVTSASINEKLSSLSMKHGNTERVYAKLKVEHEAIEAKHSAHSQKMKDKLFSHANTIEELKKAASDSVDQYERKLTNMEEKFNDSSDLSQQQSLEITANKAEKVKLENAIVHYQNLDQEKDRVLKEINAKVADMDSKHQSIFKDIMNHKQTIAEREEVESQLRMKLTDHGSQLVMKTNLISEHTATIASLTVNHNSLAQELAEHKVMHEEIHSQHQKEMAGQLDEMKKHQGSMAEMEAYFKKVLKEKDGEIEQLQYTIADNKEAIERHQDDIKAQLAALGDMDGNLFDSQNAHLNKDAQIAELVKYKRSAEMQINRHGRERDLLYKKMGIHRDASNELKQQLASKTKEITGHENDKRKQARDLVLSANNHARLQEKHERALTAHAALEVEKKKSIAVHLDALDLHKGTIEQQDARIQSVIGDYENKIEQLKEQVNNLNDDNTDKDNKIVQLEESVGAHYNNYNSSQDTLNDKEHSLNYQATLIADYQRQIEAHKGTIDEQSKMITLHSGNSSDLASQLNDAMKAVKQHQRQIKQHERGLATSRTQNAALQKQAEAQKDLHSKIKQQHASSIAEHMALLRNKDLTGSKKDAEMNKMITDYENQIGSLQETCINGDNTNKRQAQTVNDLKQRLIEHGIAIDTHENEHGAKDQLILRHQDTISAHETALLQANNEIYKHQSIVSKLKAKHADMEDHVDSLNGQLGVYRSKITALEDQVGDHQSDLQKKIYKMDSLKNGHKNALGGHAKALQLKDSEIAKHVLLIGTQDNRIREIITEYEQRCSELEERVIDKQNNVDYHRKQIEKLNGSISGHGEIINAKESRLSEAHTMLEELDRRMSHKEEIHRSSLKAVEDNVRNHKATIGSLTTELQKMKAKVQEVLIANSTLEKMNAKLSMKVSKQNMLIDARGDAIKNVINRAQKQLR